MFEGTRTEVLELIMTKETGGSAFPCEQAKTVVTEQGHLYMIDHTGMTLRDWFAGQIMAGMYANGLYSDGGDRIEGDVYRAKGAYAQADAMIEARKS